jgi:antirestriction protein ArdC
MPEMKSTDNHAELLTRLTQGIAELTRSDRWRRHLDCQARFHRYSFGNVVLIAAQRPDASRVAGFNAWRHLGRSVKKGEKAIWILAPLVTRKATEPDDEAETRRPVRGFKYVPVFDLSQTEGEELVAACNKLEEDEPTACFGRLADVARSFGYSVEVTHLRGGTNGDCAFDLRRIRVEAGNAPAQRVKTLAHEIAHALLHEDSHDRPLAELEAESTAYVVCQRLGVDSGAYSFGYVAVWAGGGEEAIAGIRASCGRIQHASARILQAVEVNDGSAPQAA